MGIPNYSIKKEIIVAIAENTNHVNLYFFSGAALSSKLLEGIGKGMWHVTIKDSAEINETELSSLLKQAEKLVLDKRKGAGRMQ